MKDENYIDVEFEYIETISLKIRTAMAKQKQLVEHLDKIDIELSHFDRVGKINRLLDEESELSQTGLVVSMETLSKKLKGLPYALEQLYTSKVSAIDSPDHKNQKELNDIALMKKSPDKLYFMHCELEQELKYIKDKRTMIRTPEMIEQKKQEEAAEDEIGGLIQNRRKKLAPWAEKAKEVREELEKADEIRDALESAQAEIKYKHRELLNEKSNTQKIKSRLDVVKLELAKQKNINKDLTHFEQEARDAEGKLLKYVEKNKKLTTENSSLAKTKSDLESQLTSYQNTLKQMKQKAKRKIKNLHEDDDHPHMAGSHSTGFDSLRRVNSVSGVGSAKRGHRRSGSLSMTPKSRQNDLGLIYGSHRNGKLGLGDPSGSYDSIDQHGNDHRMVIGSLNKQLELNKNYNSLLEKTINSLRHTHNIYDLNKQWIELKRDLRPLPSFNSMTDAEYKQYMERKERLKHEKEIKQMQKKRRREKLLVRRRRDTDDFEEVNRNLALTMSPSPKKLAKRGRNKSGSSSSDEDDEFDIDSDDETKDDDEKNEDKENDEKKDNILSSYEQKQIKKKRYESVQKSLNDLDLEFGSIYSCPEIVNLTAVNKQRHVTYNQKVIGRNLKLRDIKLKCMKLSKECKDIESNFEIDDNNKIIKNQDINDDDKNNKNTNLIPLGRVDISGLNKNKLNTINNKKQPKVCLNRTNVVKLQNYLNILC